MPNPILEMSCNRKRFPGVIALEQVNLDIYPNPLSDGEARDLAEVLKATVVRFDNLWQMPFPYVMPLHQAPTDNGDYRAFHFHIEFHPLLRRPSL